MKVVKEKDYEVAEQEAKSTVNVRFTKRPPPTWLERPGEKLRMANKGADRAVSEIEVLKAELE